MLTTLTLRLSDDDRAVIRRFQTEYNKLLQAQGAPSLTEDDALLAICLNGLAAERRFQEIRDRSQKLAANYVQVAA